MKTKLMSFDVDVPKDTKEGDVIRVRGSTSFDFKCVKVDGELVLQATMVDGVKIER